MTTDSHSDSARGAKHLGGYRSIFLAMIRLQSLDKGRRHGTDESSAADAEFLFSLFRSGSDSVEIEETEVVEFMLPLL